MLRFSTKFPKGPGRSLSCPAPFPYRLFLATALWAREAKLPLETFPPPDLATADWIRKAAFELTPTFMLLLPGLVQTAAFTPSPPPPPTTAYASPKVALSMSCRTRQWHEHLPCLATVHSDVILDRVIHGPNREYSKTVLMVARLSRSGILVRSLNLTPPKEAHDPDGICDRDQTGDQPQQSADGRVQRQAYAQTQREDQESGGEDRRMKNHSQYRHALYGTA